MNSNATSFAAFVEVNPKPSDLLFLTRILWREALAFTIIEYVDIVSHDTWSANLDSPEIYSATNRILAPRSDTEQNPLASRISGPKALVLYDVQSVEYAKSIINAYNPDLIIYQDPGYLDKVLSAAVDLPIKQVPYCSADQFASVKFNLIGHETAIHVLEAGLARLGSHYRRSITHINRTFDVGELCLAAGFWPLERYKIWTWAWTGPLNSSIFFVPITSQSRKRLTIFLFSSKVNLDQDNIAVLIDGHLVAARFHPAHLKIECSYSPIHQSFCSQVEIRVMSPVVVEDHSRRVGIALHKVRLEDEE